MPQFRKKPVLVEAVQWTGSNADEVLGFTVGHASVRDESFRRLSSSERVLVIETLEGSMRAEPNDWIIRGVNSEFYPCKPDIFAATYEPADPLPVLDRGIPPKKTWDDIVTRALHDPVLHQAVTLVERGDLTREQALVLAALALSEWSESQRRTLVEWMNTRPAAPIFLSNT